jgi:hypothetical protein
MVRVFSAGLLAKVSSHPVGSATGKLDQGFFVVFLDPRANAELVPKFHVALHASHVVLFMVTSKFHPNTDLPMLNYNFSLLEPFQRQYKHFHHKQYSPCTSSFLCSQRNLHLNILPFSLPRALPYLVPVLNYSSCHEDVHGGVELLVQNSCPQR